MTNKEFFDMMVVTGKMDNKLFRDKNISMLMQDICEDERYIGEIYLKLLKLKDTDEANILRILKNIILKYDLTSKETDVLIERFRIINIIMRRGHVKQYLSTVVQLRDCKDKLATLYSCRIQPKSDREFIVYQKENGGKIFYIIEFYDKISVRIGSKVVCDDLKYILYDNKELKFISKKEAETREEDR